MGGNDLVQWGTGCVLLFAVLSVWGVLLWPAIRTASRRSVHVRLGISLGRDDNPRYFAMQFLQAIQNGDHDKVAVGNLPAGSVSDIDLYMPLAAEVGISSILRGVRGDGMLTLGAETHVERWADAPTLLVGDHCTLPGRTTAERTLRLGKSICFCRLYAPSIETFPVPHPVPADSPEPVPKTYELFAQNSAAPVASSAQRHIYKKDLYIQKDTVVHGDIVCWGRVLVGAGATVIGRIKSRKGIVCEAGVSIIGSLVSDRDVALLIECFVSNVILAENAIRIGPYCRIGELSDPGSVCADQVILAGGVKIHGAVVAKLLGFTKDS
ncbi:MAG: hypothetical protein ACK5NY_06890 [Burkholderiaceae bacterium]